jgi:hypothetical protein
MALPHFTNLQVMNQQPIYKNLFQIDFTFGGFDCSELTHLAYKVTKNSIYFHVNIINEDIIPLDMLYELKDNNVKGKIRINFYDKTGEKIIMSLIRKGVEILDIDFEGNWNSQDIINCQVKYSFEKEIYENRANIVRLRKMKLKTLI